VSVISCDEDFYRLYDGIEGCMRFGQEDESSEHETEQSGGAKAKKTIANPFVSFWQNMNLTLLARPRIVSLIDTCPYLAMSFGDNESSNWEYHRCVTLQQSLWLCSMYLTPCLLCYCVSEHWSTLLSMPGLTLFHWFLPMVTTFRKIYHVQVSRLQSLHK